jgi:hypothetical protein
VLGCFAYEFDKSVRPTKLQQTNAQAAQPCQQIAEYLAVFPKSLQSQSGQRNYSKPTYRLSSRVNSLAGNGCGENECESGCNGKEL